MNNYLSTLLEKSTSELLSSYFNYISYSSIISIASKEDYCEICLIHSSTISQISESYLEILNQTLRITSKDILYIELVDILESEEVGSFFMGSARTSDLEEIFQISTLEEIQSFLIKSTLYFASSLVLKEEPVINNSNINEISLEDSEFMSIIDSDFFELNPNE